MADSSSRTEELKARLTAREAHMRESWVRAMEARIVQDQLKLCHRLEGVNGYETCRELGDKYITMLRENRVKGYKQIETAI
ncbi:NADH-ubiquinone oxidoreductase 12 kDa subunit [Dentipellis sp. KUC8613]|nr:NADH-ubiquinone oxidoreductase 12 kDa subunit [Dentipellis sp. KUC8613]